MVGRLIYIVSPNRYYAISILATQVQSRVLSCLFVWFDPFRPNYVKSYRDGYSWVEPVLNSG